MGGTNRRDDWCKRQYWTLRRVSKNLSKIEATIGEKKSGPSYLCDRIRVARRTPFRLQLHGFPISKSSFFENKERRPLWCYATLLRAHELRAETAHSFSMAANQQ